VYKVDPVLMFSVKTRSQTLQAKAMLASSARPAPAIGLGPAGPIRVFPADAEPLTKEGQQDRIQKAAVGSNVVVVWSDVSDAKGERIRWEGAVGQVWCIGDFVTRIEVCWRVCPHFLEPVPEEPKTFVPVRRHHCWSVEVSEPPVVQHRPFLAPSPSSSHSSEELFGDEGQAEEERGEERESDSPDVPATCMTQHQMSQYRLERARSLVSLEGFDSALAQEVRRVDAANKALLRRLEAMENAVAANAAQPNESSPKRSRESAVNSVGPDSSPADDSEEEEDIVEEPEQCLIGIGLECTGCESFACCMFPRNVGDAERAFRRAMEDQTKPAVQWCEDHSLISSPFCPGCAGTKRNIVWHQGTWVYRCAVDSCRRRWSLKRDDPTWHTHVCVVVRLALHIGKLKPIADFQKESGAAPKSIVHAVDTLCCLACLFNARGVTKGKRWAKAQWDETFVSVRKHRRGKRARKSGALVFSGGVEVEPVGDSGRVRILGGLMQQVHAKSCDAILPLVLQVTEFDAEITTDGGLCYRRLTKTGRVHKWVNHKVTFVSEDGTNSNAIESYNRCVKRVLRALWAVLHAEDGEVGKRFQLATYLANVRLRRGSLVCSLLHLVQFWARRPRGKHIDVFVDELLNASVGMFCSGRGAAYAAKCTAKLDKKDSKKRAE
jgi:hypothetical protein